MSLNQSNPISSKPPLCKRVALLAACTSPDSRVPHKCTPLLSCSPTPPPRALTRCILDADLVLSSNRWASTRTRRGRQDTQRLQLNLLRSRARLLARLPSTSGLSSCRRFRIRRHDGGNEEIVLQIVLRDQRVEHSRDRVGNRQQDDLQQPPCEKEKMPAVYLT